VELEFFELMLHSRLDSAWWHWIWTIVWSDSKL